MQFQLDFKSGKAVYLQLVDQVRMAAASGVLQPGDLRVNRNTVAKGYSELERLGIIENVPGKGCFVRENSSPFRKEVRRKLLADVIDHAAMHAHHLQIDRSDFLRLAAERFDALEHKRSRAAQV
jgi:GntR family transcriptional regulator